MDILLPARTFLYWEKADADRQVKRPDIYLSIYQHSPREFSYTRTDIIKEGPETIRIDAYRDIDHITEALTYASSVAGWTVYGGVCYASYPTGKLAMRTAEVKKCSCSIQLLIRQGCTCGGI